MDALALILIFILGEGSPTWLIIVGIVVGAIKVAAEAARAGFATGFSGTALGQDSSEALESRPELEHAVRTLFSAVGESRVFIKGMRGLPPSW